MYMVSLLSILPFTAPACGSAQGGGEAPEAPKVYFVRDITPENMVRLYEALERPATGKVAVKLSTGEPGGHNFLKPELIKELVQKVDGTIVECNTACGGGRASTENHLKAAADHGFTVIAPVDIMDAEGEVSLPVKGGRHLRENFVGSHYPAYDFTVVLSHFKGHAMGGFGGAVKNISIGIASSVLISQCLGARWPAVAYTVLTRTLKVSVASATCIVTILFFARHWLVTLYSSDTGVCAMAASLLIFGCLYHVFDAMQSVSSFALRGYRVTRLPMIIYGVMLWGVGLGGGYMLAFGNPITGEPMGAYGFWSATAAGLWLTGISLACMAVWVGRQFARDDNHTPEEIEEAVKVSRA